MVWDLVSYSWRHLSFLKALQTGSWEVTRRYAYLWVHLSHSETAHTVLSCLLSACYSRRLGALPALSIISTNNFPPSLALLHLFEGTLSFQVQIYNLYFPIKLFLFFAHTVHQFSFYVFTWIIVRVRIQTEGLLIPFWEQHIETPGWSGPPRGRERNELWIQIFQGRLVQSHVCMSLVLKPNQYSELHEPIRRWRQMKNNKNLEQYQTPTLDNDGFSVREAI